MTHYLEPLLKPIKPVRHSAITDDDLALEVIQNENWQYFIKTFLTACKTNNGSINNTINQKNIKLIENSIENITIWKHQIPHTIKNLPVHEREEIDRDLQRNNYFINLGETNEFSDHNVLYTFCDFFQQHGRFPGSQDLIAVPMSKILY